MILTIIALVIGVMILAGGMYYLRKEKNDPESKKIYLITMLIGGVILIGVIVKTIVSGF